MRSGKKGTPAYDQLVMLETTVLSSKTATEAITLGVNKYKATPAADRTLVDIQAMRDQGYTPSPFPL